MIPPMETLVALCKRRGFVYPTSEIYGGFNGFFDYGPLGVAVKRNLKDAWWRDLVERREDMVGLDSSILMHPRTWEASGHVGGFSDPMVDCRESKMRYRADQLFFSPVKVDGETIGYVSVLEDGQMEETAQAAAETLKRKEARQGTLEPVSLREFTEASPEEIALVPSPATGKPGSLTPPRDFNLMFQTNVGALSDASSVAYLRPETAQGIFSNYKNVVDTTRVKVPFGIAQIGKAFRNEITPRNFIFRTREFEQMEMEFFIEPGEENRLQWYRYWIDWCLDWLASVGLPRELLGEEVHPPEKLSHYSKGTTDITFRFPHGVQELWGIACRGDFDLKQHQEFSGTSMEYFDEARKQAGTEPFRYLPNVVEPALGVDRLFLATMAAAYREDEIPNDKGKPEKRNLLAFHPRIAPYKVAVFPLLKNKPELVSRAREIHDRLQRRFPVFWDVSGAIGRRYRRQDEIGTPFCVTVDFDTVEKDGTVTLRDRDTTKQERLSADDVVAYVSEQVEG